MNRAKIEDALLAMGVPAWIKGFNYIVDAIQIYVERGINVGITTTIYPAIAENNNTKPSSVERAIRHAFKIVRGTKGNPKVVEKYIGFKNPSNASSLKQLYMMLKREEEE